MTLITLIPLMLWMKYRRDKVPANLFYKTTSKIACKWANSLIKASGARMFVSGLENVPFDQTVLFMSNHQSDFDILVFLAYAPVPIGFVAKKELLKVPLLRTWIEMIGSVFLDRNDIRQGMKTILAGIEKLQNGHSMVVFPEGTRSKTGALLPFKTGSFKLATKPKVPIVPVTINGSYKITEGKYLKITPADVYVHFHPAVYTDGLDKNELADLPKRVEEIIQGRLS
jgi:1-acyl-sn-glycerol-3-phosphate acyltransferase